MGISKLKSWFENWGSNLGKFSKSQAFWYQKNHFCIRSQAYNCVPTYCEWFWNVSWDKAELYLYLSAPTHRLEAQFQITQNIGVYSRRSNFKTTKLNVYIWCAVKATEFAMGISNLKQAFIDCMY